jgi:hypothetical protein
MVRIRYNLINIHWPRLFVLYLKYRCEPTARAAPNPSHIFYSTSSRNCIAIIMVQRNAAASIPEPPPLSPGTVDPPALVEQHTDPPAVADALRPAHRGVGGGQGSNDENETPAVLPEPTSLPETTTAPSRQVKARRIPLYDSLSSSLILFVVTIRRMVVPDPETRAG